VQVPWLPVLAPLAVVLAYVLVIRPFWGIRRGGATTGTAASADTLG
jgi:hypothetical protein